VSAILSHDPAEWPKSPPFTFLLFENGFLVFAPVRRLGLLKSCQQFAGIGAVAINDSAEKMLIAPTV
jgi:hypothetical protein